MSALPFGWSEQYALSQALRKIEELENTVFGQTAQIAFLTEEVTRLSGLSEHPKSPSRRANARIEEKRK